MLLSVTIINFLDQLNCVCPHEYLLHFAYLLLLVVKRIAFIHIFRDFLHDLHGSLFIVPYAFTACFIRD